ncbi:MAG: AraC family transcriptional regulator [Acutalibacteraceae bacterium]|nr:AraC family transcriptional regulator [Acutalibacteraceae bacterium]
MQVPFNLRENREHGSTNFQFATYSFINKNKVIITDHWHDEIELLYVKSGTLTISVNKKNYTSKKGELAFINSRELHGVIGNNVSYYAMVFNPNMLSFSLDDAVQKQILKPLTENKLIFFNKPEISDDISCAIKNIIKLNTEQPKGYMLETKALLLMLINRLYCEEMYVKNNPSDFSTQTERNLRAILTYIVEHFSENLSLHDISKAFNMSPKYFCRFFKNHFNRTFIEYLNLVRIENAMKLLSNDDISVTEAGISCGFSNMSYFTRVFKNAVGQTPSAYKNTLSAQR